MAIVRQKQGRLEDGTEVTLKESWDKINGTVTLELKKTNPFATGPDESVMINESVMIVVFTREEWEEFTS